MKKAVTTAKAMKQRVRILEALTMEAAIRETLKVETQIRVTAPAGVMMPEAQMLETTIQVMLTWKTVIRETLIAKARTQEIQVIIKMKRTKRLEIFWMKFSDRISLLLTRTRRGLQEA